MERRIFLRYAVIVILAGLLFGCGRTGQGPSSVSPWPMFHCDLQHTGRSPYAGAQTSTLEWKFETGDSVNSSPAVAKDGTVYVGSDDGYLYAINPGGTLKWKFGTGAQVFSSPAIGKDGTVYVGSQDGCLYAINPDGTLKWKFETNDWVGSSPAVAKDGIIYVGSRDSHLYSLNANGALKWKFETDEWMESSPTVGKDGTVYVGSWDSYLYSLKPNGVLKWKFGTGAQVFSSPAIATNGTIYVGSTDGYLYAINPDGILKWKFETGAYVVSSPAIATNGTIYVGSDDGYLYAISPDGTLKWKFETGAYVSSSPAIAKDGTVYVGSEDGYLYAINDDGTLKWKFETGDSVLSSPAIAKDGIIYVGSGNGCLYAIGERATAKLAKEPSRSGSQNIIIGKWEDTTLLEGFSTLGTLEFFKDGTLLATHFYWGNTSSTGEYKFVDDSHIKLDFGVVLGLHVCTFCLSEDKLMLTYPDERGVRTYRRMAEEPAPTSTYAHPESHIIGKWEDTTLLEGFSTLGTLEFFKDGTLLATHFYWGNTSSTGEYKFVDDSHIKLDFGVVLGSYVCTFSLSQDQLILTYPDERGVRTYQRVSGGDS